MDKNGTIEFHIERTKCVHRLKAADVPRGLDPDELTLPCGEDGECPQKSKKK